MGYVLLEGGSEFGGQMADPDGLAMTLAGGSDALISIIPAAAAPDNNHLRAGQNGVKWFQGLGATQVSSLPLIDNASADSSDIALTLKKSNLIYLLGGFPSHLAQVLAGSRAWQAMMAAFNAGAVIAGSSAGAMVLCEHFYDPKTTQVVAGLNLMQGICVLPHHNTFGLTWASQLKIRLPDATLLGIDEETGALYDSLHHYWQVRGRGRVTLYQGDKAESFAARELFIL